MENSLTKQPAQYRDLWELVLLVAVAAALIGLAVWMAFSQFIPTLRNWSSRNTDYATFTQETGIRIVGVGLTAGGGIIDLRYQAIDPDKAVIVHDDENPPSFVVEATGQIVNTPYHEHSDFDAHTAVTYHELIMNPGGVLKRGSEISVLIGESRLEHVIIQ